MTTRFLDSFVRDYKLLHPTIQKKVDKAVLQLTHNLRHPSIRARKLKNQADVWEARVDYHFRVTFRIVGDVISVRRVGTHEIYRNP